jgi:deoxyribose-phosphate aldolase
MVNTPGLLEGIKLAQSIVKLIDHAVLQPTQTDDDVRAACALCAELGTASVCVKPSHVPLAAECLAGTSVLVSTVIGFPHGGTTTEAKVAETELACRQGAREVDMVANIGKALSGNWDCVEQDIRQVVQAAGRSGAITKVIFETGLLPDDATKIRLCEICEAAGAAFVKTSTGFGYAKRADGTQAATGATEHDIQLMRKHCSKAVEVKASGGIRSYDDAKRFVDLGATRLGTSGTKDIAAGERGAQTSGKAADY